MRSAHWSSGSRGSLGWMKAMIVAGATIVAILACLFAGVVAAILPWQLIAALTIGVGVLAVVLVYPPAAPALLVGVAALAPQNTVGAKASDLLLLSSMVGVLVVRGGRSTAIAEAWRAGRLVLIPIACLLVLGVLSASVGLLVLHNWRPYVYSEARVFLYWLIAPMVLLIATDEKSLRRIVFLAVTLATAIAAISALQSFTGMQLVGGKLMALEEGAAVGALVVRSQIPGMVLVAMALFIVVSALGRGGVHWTIGSAVVAILLFGLVSSFGRGLWAVSVVGVIAVIAAQGLRPLLRGLSLALVVGAICGISLYFAKPDTFNAAIERIESVKKEGGRNTSLGWREVENDLARRKIEGNPLLGIGLGGEYRSAFGRLQEFSEQTRYVHNGYLYITLKLGVMAIALLAWIGVATIVAIGRVRGRRWGLPWLPPALVTALTAPYLLSFTQPEVMSASGVACIALIVGISASLSRVASTTA